MNLVIIKSTIRNDLVLWMKKANIVKVITSLKLLNAMNCSIYYGLLHSVLLNNALLKYQE